jgi:peptide chain release factor
MEMISADKWEALRERLVRLGLNPGTVIEKFIRSGGHGGQNVNKTSTCVYLKHLASGIEVKMQRERSQGMNRFLAWRLLADKLEEKIRGAASARRQAIEKIRRQKRRRSRRAKEKMLADKHRQTEKKAQRRVGTEDL